MASAATAAAVSLRPPNQIQRSRLLGSTKSIANVAVFRTVQLRPVKRFVGLEVRMDKRKNELAEIRKMTKQEIEDKVMDLKGELFLMRCQKMLRRDEFKVWPYRNMKKHVARLMTVRREIEIAEGISRRKARSTKFRWRRETPLRPPPSLRPLLESFKERREQAAIKEREEKKIKLQAKRERQAAEREALARRDRNRARRRRFKIARARWEQLQKEQEEGMEQEV